MSSVKFVPASGKCTSGLMVIGQCPGKEEEKQGKPFVGRSGALLTKMLGYIGLERDEVIITNLIKVHPEGNRNPTFEESMSWLPSLIEEIDKVRPKVILSLGNYCSQALLMTDKGITTLRGKWCWYNLGQKGIKLIPSFHPSYILRSHSEQIKNQVKEDLNLVKKLLNN